MKVLAAEMSDPSRLRRGKQYAHDGSVLDIVVERGKVTCEIQGSRSLPYVATVAVTPGDGMPLRRDITATCTCPDDDNGDGSACKHVVATLFALADELLLEPELLDVWRGRDVPTDVVPPVAAAAEPAGRHLRLVRPDEPAPPAPVRDPLATLLVAPPGATLPAIPPIDPVDPMLPRSRPLADVLRDAVANLRHDWD
jgi:hypothetical protein